MFMSRYWNVEQKHNIKDHEEGNKMVKTWQSLYSLELH
jgi:hypothetical protein